jgi:excisionase family DNA binding protein
MRAGQTPDYLNKSQLAERLGVTRRVVEEMMRRRKIPYLSLGHRTVRFFWPTVERALSKFEHRAVGQEGK